MMLEVLCMDSKEVACTVCSCSSDDFVFEARPSKGLRRERFYD